MRKVAIVNGAARQIKYNKFLEKKYGDMGFCVKEFEFNRVHLFSHHLRKNLFPAAKDIVDNYDVIHCESGGYFPVLHYYNEVNSKKPFILECPVVRSCTGTLLAGLNVSKSYDVKDNALIQKFLDTFSFQPEWIAQTMSILKTLKDKNQILMLASHSDTVSDIRGKHEYFHHIFDKGAHGRLFFEAENNFEIVKKYVETGIIDTTLVIKK